MAWAPDYISSTDLKNYVRIGDTVDDAEIADAVIAASRAVDGRCSNPPTRRIGRQFGKVAAPEARRYTAWWDRGRGAWVVEIDDLMSTSGFTAEVLDVGPVDSYELEPINAAQEGKPWTHLVVKADSTAKPTGVEHEVSIVAAWGWTAVPGPVKQATKLQASRFLSRRGSPYGIAGSPEQGSELRLLSKVDPDVDVILTAAGLVKPPEIVFA